jgi:hypothetical protein
MRSKRKRADKRSRLFELPAEDILEAERKQLPFFEPYETGKLLADAARANNGPATDAAIADVYNEHWRAQIIQLLRALGCDLNDKQVWPKAFMKLARLHHNVGRLVHRLRSRPNAKVWTPEDEANFLLGVYALVQRGLGEREAVRRIADAKVFRITSDNLRNGHRAMLRELRANGPFGASISDCGHNRGGLTRSADSLPSA